MSTDRDPDASTVHILRHGLPLCGFTTRVPGDWPAGNTWVPVDDELVSCPGCMEAAKNPTVRRAIAWDALRSSTPEEIEGNMRIAVAIMGATIEGHEDVALHEVLKGPAVAESITEARAYLGEVLGVDWGTFKADLQGMPPGETMYGKTEDGRRVDQVRAEPLEGYPERRGQPPRPMEPYQLQQIRDAVDPKGADVEGIRHLCEKCGPCVDEGLLVDAERVRELLQHLDYLQAQIDAVEREVDYFGEDPSG